MTSFVQWLQDQLQGYHDNAGVPFGAFDAANTAQVENGQAPTPPAQLSGAQAPDLFGLLGKLGGAGGVGGLSGLLSPKGPQVVTAPPLPRGTGGGMALAPPMLSLPGGAGLNTLAQSPGAQLNPMLASAIRQRLGNAMPGTAASPAATPGTGTSPFSTLAMLSMLGLR